MDYILHLDHYLAVLLPLLGYWVYGLVGLVVFLESACILTPFLPGDGLIFALGLMAGKGLLVPEYIIVVIFSMTLIGYLLKIGILDATYRFSPFQLEGFLITIK